MTGDGTDRLDLKGMVSPFLHLKVIQRFHELKPGDTLWLEHIPPESVNDLRAILKHYPLELGEVEEKDGVTRLQLTKNTSIPL
jgi:TusA-related sulfurtransferase